MKRNILLSIAICVMLMSGTAFSQPMDPGKKPHNPEEMKKEKEKAQKMGKLRTSIEAFRGLADLYREQGKIEEAVAQMNKILDLVNSQPDDDGTLFDKFGGIYLEISEMYMKMEKFADAEKTINQGILKVAKNPEISSRLHLTLAKIYQRTGKTAEAEATFKKVIDLNAAGTK